MALLNGMNPYQNLQISQTCVITILMVSASQLMGNTFGHLLPDVTASIQVTSQQSLVKATLVMVLLVTTII